jgi:hypothetical protein
MPGWRIWILRIIPAALLFLITAVYPPAWSGIYNPVSIILQMRSGALRTQEAEGRVLPTVKSRIRMMADQLLSAKTQYYESYFWDDVEQEEAQIRIYEAAYLDGRGGGMVWGGIILLLITGGLYTVLILRRGWDTLLLSLWFAVPVVILLLTNPLAWQRYYILLIAPWSVLAGCAAIPLTSPAFTGRIRKIFARGSPAPHPEE